MMRRVGWILASTLLATIVALWSLQPWKRQRSPLTQNPEISDAETTTSEGDAGISTTESVQALIQAGKTRFAQLNSTIAAEGLPQDQWLRSYVLIDQNGQAFDSSQLLGAPYIASFFYTTCPSICVKQNDQVRILQQRLRDTPIKLVSITCDPDHDQPEILQEYADRMGAKPGRWIFLTGDFDYLRRVSSEIFFHGLHRKKEHIEKFLLMDRDGRLIAAYDWRDPVQLEILDRDARELLP